MSGRKPRSLIASLNILRITFAYFCAVLRFVRKLSRRKSAQSLVVTRATAYSSNAAAITSAMRRNSF
ncbi:hypothetical protein CIC12_02510 [Burkholderia sp. SG-MS1]|nr:hypothetical protein [Paraburkholderia sp. SG-MS1]